MARYVISDIQGCYKQFIELIAKINFNPSKDILYLVGDLVNRGSQSLEVLQWIYKNQDNIITVLGNHDFYLLGRYEGVLKAEKDETIKDIMNYKEASKLIDWLRKNPLVFQDKDYILVHAGIYPKMDFNNLLSITDEIADNLQSNKYGDFIQSIYGNKPNKWSEKLDEFDKMKFVLNSCARMRYLNKNDHSLNYKYKGDVANPKESVIPWFKVEFDPSINKKILFGHWAALGFFHDVKYISLDTGCVWGRQLTALNLENFEIFQVQYS